MDGEFQSNCQKGAKKKLRSSVGSAAVAKAESSVISGRMNYGARQYNQFNQFSNDCIT